MMLSCWMHGWTWRDLFSNVRVFPVYWRGIYSLLPNLPNCLKPALLLSSITAHFVCHCVLLTASQDILWRPRAPWYFTVLSYIGVLMTCENPRAFSNNVVNAGRYAKETTILFHVFEWEELRFELHSWFQDLEDSVSHHRDFYKTF